METRFLLEGYKRKDLAKALAGILETEVNYLDMPSMSYRIGNSFSFLDMSVKMQGQTCNSLCNYSDTGINRRRLHGIFLRHLFSGRRRSKEKPEHRRFGQLRFIPAFE
jgi:hypothetical protein